MTQILTDPDQPIVFRTSELLVADAALQTGSLWLRSGEYFAQSEDKIRNDQHEGSSMGLLTMGMTVRNLTFVIGGGHLGKGIIPHYILSMHGLSIADDIRTGFGGSTIGIRNFAKLADEILAETSKQITCTKKRSGQVVYQYTALQLTPAPKDGGTIAAVGGTPAMYLDTHTTDVLRKRPVEPFIRQDEWRIAIFTEGYLSDNPELPLKLHVDPSNFYPFI